MRKFSLTFITRSLCSRRFIVSITLLSLLLSLAPPVTRADLGTTATWSAPVAEASTGVAWADCDADGDLDLAVANDGQPNRVYRNNGDHTFQLAWSSVETDESYAIAWDDDDLDGDPDLAVGNNYGQPNRIYHNEGNCTFALAWSSAERDWTTSLAWADFDLDGDPDLAIGNRNQPNRVYRNDGGGAFTLLWSSAESDFTTAIAVADYNGDNYPDLAAGNENQPIRLYRNNGDGTFTLDWSSAGANWTTGLAWGDYDGNGDPDLAVGNAGQPNQVYRNDGGVLTLDWSSPIADDNTSAVAWGDWDVDGDLDLAVANRGRPSRVYENIAGTLTSAWLSVEQDYATALAWGNWDADEDVELAVANWQAPDRIYDSIGHVRVHSIKQVDKAVARPDETLRYTVVISNTGSLPAIGAHFTDTLPALVTWADALTVNPDVGSYGYDAVGRVITWTGDVAANSAVVLAYQATTLDGLAGGTLITNTALVDDNEGHIVPTAPVTTVIEIPPTVGPPTVTTSTTCSQTVTFPLTVTLGYPAVQRADVVFLLDRSGTMNDVTDEVIAHSADIMNQVAALVSDAAFGAGYFADYNGSFSGCGYGDAYGGGSDVPWAVASDITADTAAVEQALQVLPRMGESDAPEDYSRALWETLPAQGTFSWRPDSKRIVVLFGDAPPHDCAFCGYTTGPDPGRDGLVGTADDLVYADVVDQLVAAGITVFTIAYDPSPCASDVFNRVATATDGAYYRARQIDQVPQAVVDLIREAVDGVDLTVGVDPTSYAGWVVSVSPPAYYDVPALESRVFQVSLHAPCGTLERWHTFDLVALADRCEIGRVLVNIDLDLSGCDCPIPPPCYIVKTVDRGEAGLGETLTYVITVNNGSGSDLVGATVSDFFPAEVTWNGIITASSGVTTVVGNLLTWQGDVPVGGTVTIAYQATVNSPLPDGTLIVNTARLEGHCTVQATTVVRAPEFHFSRKSASRLMVRPDDPITYTIVVRNTGHADASDVLVTDTLPAEVTWDDALTATSGIYTFANNTVTWNGPIVAGEQVTITYRVLARSPVSGTLPSGTLIVNTATIDDHVFPPFETDPAQTVVGFCQVTGDKTIQPALVDYGDRVSVSLVLTASCSVTVPHAADVMLAIDRSGSMAGTRLAEVQNAAQGFVAYMNLPPDQVGLVSFDGTASLDAPLTDEGALVQVAIGALTADGGTDMAAGLALAQAELAGFRHVPFHVPAIVLLTDGQSEPASARAAANAAKAAGTLIFTIGLGEDADHALLRELASAPDAYYYAPTGADLAAIYAEIAAISHLIGSNLILSDTLASAATLVPASFTGPLTPTLVGERTLIWNTAAIFPQRLDLGYRAVPTACGVYALNDLALLTYRDLNGDVVQFDLPSPQVRVRCMSVAVYKEVEQATVRPGEALTYTIVISGMGGIGSTQLAVTDTLPSGVVWGDFLPPAPGTPLYADGVITWTGVVSADTSVTIRYRVTASRTLTDGAVITNTASAEDETGTVYATFPPAETRVIAPDLSPSHKIASRATMRPGEQMTYTLVLVNSGGAEAVGAWLTDTLPVDVSPIGQPVANMGSVGVTGQVITWTGTVSTVVPVNIAVAVTVSSSPTTNLLVNEAEVDDGRGWLTTLGPVTTSILGLHTYMPVICKGFVALPDLLVSAITIEPPTVSASQPVTVYVHVTNVGNAAVHGPFWVDLYVDCDEGRMPPGPNEIWPDLGCKYGVAWLVDDDHTPGVLPLEPGETVTLDSNRYPTEQIWSYWPGYFPAPPASHVLYAKADAYNGDVPYSAVLEMDEDNNTLGPITVTVTGGFSLPALSVPPRPSLAPRPAPGTFSHP